MNTKTIEQIAKLILVKNTMPIMQNLKVENNEVVISDLELTVKIGHQSKMKKGILSLQEIPFYLDGDKNHREEELQEYPSFNYNFPECRKVFFSDTITKALSDACSFASNDESRTNICCVLLEKKDDKFNVVATNGHCLYVSNVQELTNDSVDKIKCDVLLPVKNLEKILKISRILGEKDFYFTYDSDKSMACINFDDITIYLRCVDGKFPDYRQVFPQGNASVWELKNLDSKAISRFLNQSLKHNKSLVDDENGHSKRRGIHKIISQLGIRIHCNSAITMKYKDLASFTIEAEKLTGNDLDICLDANYLDVVLGLKPNYLKIKDALSPVIFEINENTTALMMPMRME